MTSQSQIDNIVGLFKVKEHNIPHISTFTTPPTYTSIQLFQDEIKENIISIPAPNIYLGYVSLVMLKKLHQRKRIGVHQSKRLRLHTYITRKNSHKVSKRWCHCVSKTISILRNDPSILKTATYIYHMAHNSHSPKAPDIQ